MFASKNGWRKENDRIIFVEGEKRIDDYATHIKRGREGEYKFMNKKKLRLEHIRQFRNEAVTIVFGNLTSFTVEVNISIAEKNE
jgi:hypothetical protein